MDQHEPIELGLGQFERARLLDGILRGDDEERRRQREVLVADRHPSFLHGFEQSALHFGGGAIDLVGQEQVREHRSLAHANSLVR